MKGVETKLCQPICKSTVCTLIHHIECFTLPQEVSNQQDKYLDSNRMHAIVKTVTAKLVSGPLKCKVHFIPHLIGL